MYLYDDSVVYNIFLYCYYFVWQVLISKIVFFFFFKYQNMYALCTPNINLVVEEFYAFLGVMFLTAPSK